VLRWVSFRPRHATCTFHDPRPIAGIRPNFERTAHINSTQDVLWPWQPRWRRLWKVVWPKNAVYGGAVASTHRLRRSSFTIERCAFRQVASPMKFPRVMWRSFTSPASRRYSINRLL
jgi:hypothetical protein